MKMYIWALFLVIFIPTTMFAIDTVQNTVPASSSSGSGSAGNTITIFANGMQYMNSNNDTTVIGNYFSGSYYDSTFGYFDTNWSSDPLDNMRIGLPTPLCAGSLGYRIVGYARGVAGGYIRFDYDATNYVYVCASDNTLRGYAFSSHIGWQNFNGIQLGDIANASIVTETLPNSPTPFFTNNITNIFTRDPDPFSIQGDIKSVEGGKESTFYFTK